MTAPDFSRAGLERVSTISIHSWSAHDRTSFQSAPVSSAYQRSASTRGARMTAPDFGRDDLERVSAITITHGARMTAPDVSRDGLERVRTLDHHSSAERA
jgi:hypothetical protein